VSVTGARGGIWVEHVATFTRCAEKPSRGSPSSTLDGELSPWQALAHSVRHRRRQAVHPRGARPHPGDRDQPGRSAHQRDPKTFHVVQSASRRPARNQLDPHPYNIVTGGSPRSGPDRTPCVGKLPARRVRRCLARVRVLGAHVARLRLEGQPRVQRAHRPCEATHGGVHAVGFRARHSRGVSAAGDLDDPGIFAAGANGTHNRPAAKNLTLRLGRPLVGFVA
jgi:hypothetical protein